MIANQRIWSHAGMQNFYPASPQIAVVSSCLGTKGTDWKNGRLSVTSGADGRRENVSVYLDTLYNIANI